MDYAIYMLGTLDRDILHVLKRFYLDRSTVLLIMREDLWLHWVVLDRPTIG